MMQFAQQFPEFRILSQPATKLSWPHFIEVFSLKEELQREFYITLAAFERWGRGKLRKEIDGMRYERTAISTKPDELIKQELTQLRDDNVISIRYCHYFGCYCWYCDTIFNEPQE